MSNDKLRPFWEILAGLVAQVATFGLMCLWFSSHPQPEDFTFGTMLNILLVVGAFFLSGPSVVFVLRRGDLTTRLFAVACYIAISFFLAFVGLMLMGIVGTVISRY